MTKTLSLADMARHFSLPESTARYYCKRFAPFMTIYGEGRRKRYGEQCLTVISTIMEHMKMGKTANMVEEFLDTRFTRTMDATFTRSGPTFEATSSAQDSSQNSFSDHKHAPSAFVHQMGDFEQNQGMAPLGNYSPAMQAPSGIQNAHQPMDGFAGQMFMQHLEQQSQALQSIAQSLAVLATQKNDMQRMEDAARTAKEENTLLRQEVSVLKNLLHSSEQVHHDDLSQMRTWMSRLAQSYNNRTSMDTQQHPSASSPAQAPPQNSAQPPAQEQNKE